MDDLVRVRIVPNEVAADVVCTFLRAEGIRCAHRVTNVGAGSWDGVPNVGGAREVLARCEWLLLEHSPAYLAQSGADIDALVDLLVDSGFTPYAPKGAAALQAIEINELRHDPAQRDVLWGRR